MTFLLANEQFRLHLMGSTTIHLHTLTTVVHVVTLTQSNGISIACIRSQYVDGVLVLCLLACVGLSIQLVLSTINF